MKRRTGIVLLAAVVLTFAGLHLMAGARLSSPTLVWQALTDYDPRNYQHVVIVKQRLTRLAVAAYAGSVLSVSGLLLQKVLNNDLVSPSTLGVNSGAVSFVVLGIYLYGLEGAALFWPALAGGCAGVAVSFLAAGLIQQSKRDPLSLVLGGAMTATLFSSVTTFVISIDPDRFGDLMGWLVGDIGNFDYQPLLLLWPVGLAGLTFAVILARPIDVLGLGLEQAAGLGVNPIAIRAGALTVAIPLAVSAVCIVGPIGFVGLVAPHICRLLLGETGRGLVFVSAFVGALIVISADIVARILLAPQLLNVGTVMALCGGLAFLAIILTRLRKRPT